MLLTTKNIYLKKKTGDCGKFFIILPSLQGGQNGSPDQLSPVLADHFILLSTN